ncbi:hypothetical protein [Kineococcus sp. SYSU DK003]|uniref:hypothetical protein n=1 Tax=Kineococcus sp. SYSU DK003 TaxID=3383124 RepID=UPI003D7D7038
MHPLTTQTIPVRPAPTRPAPQRGPQHRADGRSGGVALPAHRPPRAVELTDAESGTVLTSVLAGLQAIPGEPAVGLPTRLVRSLREVVARLDLAGYALVAGAGAAASLALTLVLVLWLAGSGRLG